MSIVGVEPNEITVDRVEAKASARFLHITKENPFSEITEVTHTEANSF